MRINHNIGALNTHRQLSANTANQSKNIERLSSGLRINRAGDDAAGLAISEKMRGQIRGLDQASRNAQDGISLIQTAEGALNETHSILQRMRELTVQSNNGTNTADDLTEIQKEISESVAEIDRIASKTEFNTKTLLNGNIGTKAANGTALISDFTAKGISLDVSGVKSGATLTFTLVANTSVAVSDGTTTQVLTQDPDSVTAGSTLNFDKLGLKMSFASNADLTAGFGGASLTTKTITTSGNQLSFQIGANQNTTLDISINDMSSTAVGTGTGNANVTSVGLVNVTNQSFTENIKAVDQAIKQVSAQRSQLGAWQNRLDHTINNLNTSSENLTAAESRVRDVDMAKEMMEQTKNSILAQAAQAMLAQANQQPQGVLQLLR
ncbi:flagellin [Paenibacillus montanisoli]|uniref:Flagellin n=1 Tax=Paenibacillus montanisoli TaxID=2081970 RepID=A0A328TW99_9BACL|nr:flagellin [Paenibacillus montanisoli]RAP73932.1 flagellin [Paenibacillus montanisoli]